jgi:hypothetical protein
MRTRKGKQGKQDEQAKQAKREPSAGAHACLPSLGITLAQSTQSIEKSEAQRIDKEERERTIAALMATRDRAHLRWQMLIRGMGSMLLSNPYWVYETDAASGMLESMNAELRRALEALNAAEAALNPYKDELHGGRKHTGRRRRRQV